VPPFYGQYSLQPTRTDLRFNADTLFPDLEQHSGIPGAVLDEPGQPTAYTFQWNGNVQHTFSNSYLFEVAYTGSHSYNEHKRYNINQAQPGTTPIVTRVPYPAFQSAILYSSDAGRAQFPRDDGSRRQALFGRAVLPRQLSAVEEHRQRIRRD
jgi:hypothetical protein